MKGDQPKTRWFGIAFFGLGTLVSAGMLVPTAAHLTLDGEGFEATVLFRRFPTRWEDPLRFEAATTPIAGRPVVMFDDATAGHSLLRQRNRGTSGRNASLADTYGLTSQNLASLMEDGASARSTRAPPVELGKAFRVRAP